MATQFEKLLFLNECINVLHRNWLELRKSKVDWTRNATIAAFLTFVNKSLISNRTDVMGCVQRIQISNTSSKIIIKC